MFDYNSKKWRRKAHSVLRKHKFLCAESLRYGKRVDAEVVHHIYPTDEFPEYAFEDWNLLPLTRANHNKMHIRDTQELTALGKSWQRRTRPPSGKGTP